jgi:hypothetical protein
MSAGFAWPARTGWAAKAIDAPCVRERSRPKRGGNCSNRFRPNSDKHYRQYDRVAAGRGRSDRIMKES